MTGTILRTARLFDRHSRRSFMVAFDRPLATGPEPFADDSSRTLTAILAAGPDAVLVSPGALRRLGGLAAHRGGPSLVCRIDYPFVPTASHGAGEEFRTILSVSEAAAIGADAVVMFLQSHHHDRRVWADNVAAVGATSEECHRLGVPLLVEAVPWGAASPDQRDPSAVAEVARIAVELGADLIKTEWVGSGDAMADVVRACPVPVLLLGGPRVEDPELLAFTSEALSAGVRGVVYGRNVWQRPDVTRIAEELRDLIHGRTG